MSNFKSIFEKRIDSILKSEMYFFLFLIVITIVYHMDGDAHQYYNTGPYWNNVHGFFSLVIIILFGLYFWFCILFPFIWIIQAILMGRFNIFRKRLGLNFLIILFYLGAVVALFSLYSIGERQGFIRRKSGNSSRLYPSADMGNEVQPEQLCFR